MSTTRGSKAVVGHASQQGQRFFALHSFAVGPVAASRIVKVDHRDDSRDQRNGFALEAFRITTAVPFFMVVANDVFYRIREVNSPENVATYRRVDFHLGKLGFS